MLVIKEGNSTRFLCTICGEELNLKSAKDNGLYTFPCNGKNYKVYTLRCPICSTETHISQKFLDDLKKD